MVAVSCSELLDSSAADSSLRIALAVEERSHFDDVLLHDEVDTVWEALE